jgi:RNA polymerase primary sigma factor
MSSVRDERKRTRGYRGALRTYLEAIRRVEFLSPSGEFRLAARSQERDEEARKALVEANLRYVVKIAHEYRRYGTPLEDLIAEGNLGLMVAAERFDPSRQVRFSHYSAWWIRKYMVSALSRNLAQSSSPSPADAIPVPAESRPAAPRGRAPADPARRRRGRQKLVSLEAFTRENGDRGFVETLAANNEHPSALILQKELADAIRTVLHLLPRQERLILTTRYGLDGDEPMTLHEIGRAMGLTCERVRQLEVGALSRARRLLLARKIRPR